MCSSLIKSEDGSIQLSMLPVYSSDPNSENKSFSDYTPSGKLDLSISSGTKAADYFEQGREYYVDITLAEEKTEEAAQASEGTAA